MGGGLATPTERLQPDTTLPAASLSHLHGRLVASNHAEVIECRVSSACSSGESEQRNREGRSRVAAHVFAMSIVEAKKAAVAAQIWGLRRQTALQGMDGPWGSPAMAHSHRGEAAEGPAERPEYIYFSKGCKNINIPAQEWGSTLVTGVPKSTTGRRVG